MPENKNPIAKVGVIELELLFHSRWGGTYSKANKGWAVYKLIANGRQVIFPSLRIMQRLARKYLKVRYREPPCNELSRFSFNRHLDIGLWKGTTLEQRAAFVGAVCANIEHVTFETH